MGSSGISGEVVSRIWQAAVGHYRGAHHGFASQSYQVSLSVQWAISGLAATNDAVPAGYDLTRNIIQEMTMFHRGQKVVCVDANGHNRYVPKGVVTAGNNMHGLTKDKIYTIRDAAFDFRGIPCVRLEELQRPYEHLIGGEAGYAAARFRPVQEKKTDISVFTKMLTRNKKTVEA